MSGLQPSTRDNTKPVTEEQFMHGMWISLAVGLYYTFNAYLPIVSWYGWRKKDILAMSTNSLYKTSWYLLYASHFIVFTPMALLWPFTYSGSSVVVEFYDLANWYLGSVVAAGVYLSVASVFALSIMTYSEATEVSQR